MMRSPSLPLSDYDELSSPDPLANSSSSRIPVATRSPSPPKRRLSSPAKSSRSKRSFHNPSSPQSPQSFAPYPISPSRTVTEQTLSPWKIRVTVEAEHEDGDDAAETMTRTIKVPLRQESSPINTEAGGVRGRRSAPSSSRTKRSGTPIRRRSRSRSRSRRQSVTDLNIAPLGDDGDSDEWTQKKRSPRKRRTARAQRAQTEQSDALLVGEDEGAAPPVPNNPSRSNARRSLPFEIHEDEAAADGDLVDQQPDSQSPELRQIDLNRVSVRPRSQSTRRKEGRELPSENNDVADRPGNKLNLPTEAPRKVSETSAMSYPTPSPTSSYQGSDEIVQAVDSVQEREGFDTILESEGFTMINLDSIPSARQFLSSPEEQNTQDGKPERTANQQATSDLQTPGSKRLPQPLSQKKLTPIPSYLTIGDDESELSSNVPSSPPPTSTGMLAVSAQAFKSCNRKVTPEPYSSPRLPQPPQLQKGFPNNARDQSPPRGVMSASMALQGALTSSDSGSKLSAQSRGSRTPSSLQDDYFDGFSSGTKRELRAGLRFGEELAKRQRSISVPSKAVANASANSELASDAKVIVPQVNPQVTTEIWRGEAIVQHSPVTTDSTAQTKDGGHQLSLDGGMDDSPLLSSAPTEAKASSRLASSTTQTPKTSLTDVGIAQLNTTARREHEWHLEREAVSREIENASPSKVIVVDSESDEEEGTHARGGQPHHTRAHPTQREGSSGRALEDWQQWREANSPDQAIHGTYAATSAHASEVGESQLGAVEGAMNRAQREDSHLSNAEDEDQEDIWLQEAKDNSSSPREQEPGGMFTRTEQRRQRERAAQIMNKPRRSLIPSPWKRGEGVADASTFVSNGDLSGLLWQQPQQATKFGAGDIARQKRQLSGNFDLDRMLSSPVKLATVGGANLTLRKSDEHECRKRGIDAEPLSGEAEMDEDDTQAGDMDGPEDCEQGESEVTEEHSSPASSPLPPQTIPVNFNDSTLSTAATPPRSAMKGGRLSFSPPKAEVHNEIRRVVFSERSLYLNSDGDESSMSAKLDSPAPEGETFDELDGQLDREGTDGASTSRVESSKRGKGSSWLSWVWRGKTDESTLDSSQVSVLRLDGTDDIAAGEVEVEVEAEENEINGEPGHEAVQRQWQSVNTSAPTFRPPSPSQTPQPTTGSRKPKPNPKSNLPSYLLPPSYPSDPTRDPSIPLATRGEFTNAHFRTLHVIHAKSQRPRFHAPRRVRPEVRRLAGWRLEVDETEFLCANQRCGRKEAAGEGEEQGGLLEWTVGRKEMDVLERFMQEVEYGHVCAGSERVRWGWGVEELAERLGMIVVGEVVRREERERDVSARA